MRSERQHEQKQCFWRVRCIDQRSHFGISYGAVPKSKGLDEITATCLAPIRGQGLDTELTSCNVTNAAVTCALTEGFGHNQGLTKLDDCYMRLTKLADCYMDFSVLADGLRGNSCLKCPFSRMGCAEIIVV